MTRSSLKLFCIMVVLALILPACTSIKPANNDLTGTWYQNGTSGTDVIWEFQPDGTVSVRSWTGTGRQSGIYRKLKGNRVAPDFGGNAVSIVSIMVADKRMVMMPYPDGAQTILEKK